MRARVSRAIGISIACAMIGAPVFAQSFNAPTDGSSGSSQNPSSDTDKPLFPEPLFSDQPLFSNESMTNQLDSDMQRLEQAKQPPRQARPSVSSQIQTAQLDDEMRTQIRRVSYLLYNYSLRNSSRFPSAVNSQDEVYFMQVQCQEMVPNNPYNYGPTETMNWGIPATFNANGSAATGSPVWGDQWTEHLQAQNNNRVQLITDQSLTPAQVDEWATHPPDDWTAPPGTITAIGNNQGFFIVWGAGADGKPIKNPANGNTFIVAVSTSGTMNDRAAPNEI